MKIYIGPYLSYVGAYQIAEMLCFWVKKDKNGCKPHWVHEFGTLLANDKNGNESYLQRLCTWIHSHKKRKVIIKTHEYDHWNAHNTMSMIILPIMRDLRDAKQGAGYVDDEDVPEHLRSTSAPPKENEWDTDANFFLRYEWVLDEVIWALEQDNSDWEDKFVIEHAELDLKEYPEDKGKETIPVRRIKRGKYDFEGKKIYQDRITNGFRLFGKYYQSYWQ